MKQFAESLAATVQATGGLALLALPAVVPLLLFGGLVQAGRGYWGRGTETRQWANDILASSTDELELELAKDILEFC